MTDNDDRGGTYADLMEEVEKKEKKVKSPTPPKPKTKPKRAKKEVKKFTSKEVSKPVSEPVDPPVNKVGYYFTRKEIERVEEMWFQLRKTLNRKITKNDIIRSCLAMGYEDWSKKKLTSKLVKKLTSK